jgi:hypothetical protein
MGKVLAIVRGPEDYFDGVLHPPGSVVEVDEAFVSEADTIETEVTVSLAQPFEDKNGVLRRTITEVIKKKTRFRPMTALEGAIDAAPDAAPVQPDRLNLTDLLKGGVPDVVAKIESGSLDDFLPALAQAETLGKGRKMVLDAVEARQRGA